MDPPPTRHLSICLPRNDFCTAEPQTIIYSSTHRAAVHDAKYFDSPVSPKPPIPTTFPPSKRSLAPLTEAGEFVTRFQTYPFCHATLQPANPSPRRPDSSSSQSDNLTLVPATSYNVELHAPIPSFHRGRGEVLQHLQHYVFRPSFAHADVSSIKLSFPHPENFFSTRATSS
jgi:hypothetical protein